MIGANVLAWQLANMKNGGGQKGPQVLRGAEILGPEYPPKFSEFIGQENARWRLLAAIEAASLQGKRLDHILLDSGVPGIGKTALARLTAAFRNVGFVELGGSVRDQDVAAALRVMEDGDVLFLDEIHRLVAHGKSGAEWLLTLMQDGKLQLRSGTIDAPDITVIGATTDAQRLPDSILTRFKVQPVLEAYTDEEAVQIALLSAKRLGFGDRLPLPAEDEWLKEVARACDNNPRRMGNLLIGVRDDALSSKCANLDVDKGYDIKQALTWAGLTEDGLTRDAQDYLLHLFAMGGGPVGIASIKALLSTEVLTHTEKLLGQRYYIQVTNRGRELTEFGRERARALATEKMETHA